MKHTRKRSIKSYKDLNQKMRMNHHSLSRMLLNDSLNVKQNQILSQPLQDKLMTLQTQVVSQKVQLQYYLTNQKLEKPFSLSTLQSDTLKCENQYCTSIQKMDSLKSWIGSFNPQLIKLKRNYTAENLISLNNAISESLLASGWNLLLKGFLLWLQTATTSEIESLNLKLKV